VPIAKAEMALITGILVPWYVLLGVSCARLTIFYTTNKDTVDRAYADGQRMLVLLEKLRAEHPALFNKLLSKAAHDVIAHLPEGITGEDVGFFLGRVIRGVDHLPEITLAAIIKTIAVVALLVSATHLPSVTAHVVAHQAKEHAEELRQRLAEAGYTVSRAEAEEILRDALSKPDLDSTLAELQMVAKDLTPTLEDIRRMVIPGN
jgi:hypothetical protein